MGKKPVQRHMFEAVSAWLRETSRAVIGGADPPPELPEMLSAAAAAIDDYGEHLNRLRAAIGPDLVRQAEEETRDKQSVHGMAPGGIEPAPVEANP